MTPRHPRQMVRLRVSIAGSEPEIWRTLDIADSLALARLHDVIQAAFGWQNSHLHRFLDHDPDAAASGIPRIGRTPRSWADAWSLAEMEIEGEEDEADTTIGEAMALDGPLWYIYDLGDDWVHRIDLVDRDAARIGEAPATIVTGERRAPFEDSGGVDGYGEVCAVLADPKHPEHRDTADWVTTAIGPWGSRDPEDPDLDGARGELDALFGAAAADMSGLVDPATGVTADSPIAVFAADLPVPYRVNLRRHLRRSGLLSPPELTAETAADSTRPYEWLLNHIGDEGLTLTKAGWMPPASVLEGMTELGWSEHWIGEANREDLTDPMRRLRASAERLRLIRKVKGRLEVVARVKKVVGSREMLAAETARMLLRHRMSEAQAVAGTALVLGLADGAVTTVQDAHRCVIDLMSGLGYTGRDGKPLDGRWFASLVEPVLDPLEVLGLWRGGVRTRDAPPSAALRALATLALR